MQNDDPAGDGGAARAFDPRNAQHVYRVAAEAMELIQRHAALPDPIAYSVWFAYAAKSNAGLVEAVAKKLAKN